MKRYIAVLISLILFFGKSEVYAVGPGLLPAAEMAAAGREKALDTSKPVEIKMYFVGAGFSTEDEDDAVIEAVNDYLAERGLNMTWSPVWDGWNPQQGLPAIKSGAAIDIYCTGNWMSHEYSALAGEGAWVRLDKPDDNLLDGYGQDVKAALPEQLWEGATVIGASGYGIYGVPSYMREPEYPAFQVNLTLLERYGYTIEDIANTDYYGFGDILAAVKEGEGEDFYPLLLDGILLERMVTGSAVISGESSIDLNDVSHLFSYYFDVHDVAGERGDGRIYNKYATEEYRKFADKSREYYQAGYINPASYATSSSDELTVFNGQEFWEAEMSGRYLIRNTLLTRPDAAEVFSMEQGMPIGFVPAGMPYTDTNTAQASIMAVSAASEHPEHAMAFLNLLNTDPYLMTLINYGIEGVHYKMEEGRAVLDGDNSVMYQPWRTGIGNATILPDLEGLVAWEEFVKMFESAQPLPISGYSFVADRETSERLDACSVVVLKYIYELNVGALDPDETLPVLLEELTACGLDELAEEANAQLDVFLAAKEQAQKDAPELSASVETAPDKTVLVPSEWVSEETASEEAVPEEETEVSDWEDPWDENYTVTVIVESGDCLWDIAREYIGEGRWYEVIYEWNRDIIEPRNQKNKMPEYTVYPGQVLEFPHVRKSGKIYLK